MSYYNQVNLIIVVENTDAPNTALIEALALHDKIVTIVNGINVGIATALNKGAREAIQRGYEFLLTMDQDSFALPEMVDTLKECFLNNDKHPLAIASPFHLTVEDEMPDPTARSFQDVMEVDAVWTSGNLLNLSAYKVAGPFEDDLFIDFVDYEYCLRLKRHGYRIVQSNRAILRHTIGNNLTRINTFFLPLYVSHHAPLRRYYITRNRFRVRKKYNEFKAFCRTDRRRFWAELVLILLFEKQKLEKFKMVLKGYYDYRCGITGKYKSTRCIRKID
jgi:rhamnosyltransferase